MYNLIYPVTNDSNTCTFSDNFIPLNFKMPERLVDDCELKALAIEDPIERYSQKL